MQVRAKAHFKEYPFLDIAINKFWNEHVFMLRDFFRWHQSIERVVGKAVFLKRYGVKVVRECNAGVYLLVYVVQFVFKACKHVKITSKWLATTWILYRWNLIFEDHQRKFFWIDASIHSLHSHDWDELRMISNFISHNSSYWFAKVNRTKMADFT